ncbi:unnamed protein product (macronuclear) [Paramecium tetraurelia]|uniref:Tim10-like domain-containing protein n=1 Tax=Paramecium tetraurelia TaxID=5888 RepID=A0CID1_PARTE|nr:uncharacterized protein GSPATT00007683001 [Paramecium tetraurelia]CAK70548.1 unnamed protein product [Paramecium tetraurelia]|eukprot:XP_001437945.1 hypothetical protein (macronuclear) [Paramecium tetraurelia strain d4-2]
MDNKHYDDEIKTLGFSLCYKSCLKNRDAIKTSHIHHTLYPCMENCAIKYKKVVEIVMN